MVDVRLSFKYASGSLDTKWPHQIAFFQYLHQNQFVFRIQKRKH